MSKKPTSIPLPFPVIKIILICLALSGCDADPVERVSISPFTEGQICRAAIAKMFIKHDDPRRVKLLRSYEPNGIIYTRYRGDGKWVDDKCRILGNRIEWGVMPNGRWRNHPLDSVLTFSVGGGVLVITETHSDESFSVKSFRLNNFN